MNFKQKIRSVNSLRKPFITDVTVIKFATPRAIPISEKALIVEINF